MTMPLFRRMRLGKLPTFTTAIALYRSLGFAPTDASYETPLAGTLFLVKEIGWPEVADRPIVAGSPAADAPGQPTFGP